MHSINHSFGIYLSAILISLVIATSSKAQQAPQELISLYTQQAPVLDGTIDDVWNSAPAHRVTVREAMGGINPQEVIFRSLHTDEMLYVLVQWEDDTRSDMRDPFVWNAETSSYERPTIADDQFALEFPLEGELMVNMLAEGHSYTADVWHWKAGRSNLDGWVDDKRHLISPTPIPGGLPYALGGRATVHIARPMDSGQASYASIDPPAQFAGEIVPSYVSQSPDGSQQDVPGKGIHDGSSWTLEMGRRFVTGNEDDTAINPETGILCAIAILDDELYWHHSVSDLLILKFHR